MVQLVSSSVLDSCEICTVTTTTGISMTVNVVTIGRLSYTRAVLAAGSGLTTVATLSMYSMPQTPELTMPLTVTLARLCYVVVMEEVSLGSEALIVMTARLTISLESLRFCVSLIDVLMYS